MDLYKFQSQVGTKDAFAIRARQLDENFARLCPQTNGTYGINETGNGWSLNIFPAVPSTASVPYLLSYQGGMQWLDAKALIQKYAPAVSSGSGSGSGGSGGTTTGGTSIPNPPTGTAAWRLVQRCDGQVMYVWGTDWGTA